MRPLICLIFSGLLLNGPLAAKHWHEDQKHWNKHANHDDNDDHGYKHQAKGCYFEPRETRVITQYYAPRRSELPPGLQKKLYRSGRLPPGWERRMQPLPVVVERQLSPVPAGYSRGYMDGYAVVYSPRTQVVIDIVAVFGR
jgi:hypothetical protein